MTEELEVLGIVAERLEGAGIAYMVTGSIAMSYYAVPRMTRDIDVVVELVPGDVERVLAVFGEDFYVDADAARLAVADRASFNLIHDRLVVKVDFIVRKDTEYRREEFRRRRRVEVDTQTITLVAPEDLIISKLDWARASRSQVQLADVRNLLTAGIDLDHGYISQWVDHLDLGALYREAAG